jgi:hypothetical protein
VAPQVPPGPAIGTRIMAVTWENSVHLVG